MQRQRPWKTGWVFWGKVAQWQGTGRPGVEDIGSELTGPGWEIESLGFSLNAIGAIGTDHSLGVTASEERFAL